jgi:hypothetical protein
MSDRLWISTMLNNGQEGLRAVTHQSLVSRFVTILQECDLLGEQDRLGLNDY